MPHKSRDSDNQSTRCCSRAVANFIDMNGHRNEFGRTASRAVTRATPSIPTVRFLPFSRLCKLLCKRKHVAGGQMTNTVVAQKGTRTVFSIPEPEGKLASVGHQCCLDVTSGTGTDRTSYQHFQTAFNKLLQETISHMHDFSTETKK